MKTKPGIGMGKRWASLALSPAYELHIHQNVAGMLSRVNEVFSRESINIGAQFLQTDARVGYVVIDVSTTAAHAAELKDALAAIPGTLRARVLY